MPKLIATHEVDDVTHWLSSPKREEVSGSVASNISTFVDPSRPNHVGLSMEVADMAAFDAVMQSQAGTAAMTYDGVHPDTLAGEWCAASPRGHRAGRVARKRELASSSVLMRTPEYRRRC